VTAAKHAGGRRAPGAERALVVELVGAAGAGKSTLVAELQRRDASVRWLQRARAARTGATMRVVPAWLAAASRAPLGYAWRNARFFLRHAALEEVVRRTARDAAGPVLLEHGPVFTRARLRAFHAGPMPAPLARYAARQLARWTTMLDLVVALDAPLDVLAERVRTRDKDHAMRDSSDEQFGDFVERYRAAYEAVLAELLAAGGPPLLTLHSDRETVTAMADRVEAAFAERRHAR
jgi:predicted ATPase